MTKTEAQERLQRIMEKTPIRTNGDDLEALDMAIQALPQEPTKEEQALLQKWRDNRGISIEDFEDAMNALQEPCDDAISREWLMRRATERFYTTNYFNHISAMIEEAPSVTQKSGKWIEHPEIETTTPEYLMFYECSECGDKPCFCKSDIHKKRFCSNCGAKMIESQESEVV